MSVHEGLPMTLIEAMSVGLPVVATEVGGIPEAVTHDKTGLLVPRESKALADALRTLLKSPDKWRSISVAAREEFRSRFELRHIVEEYDAVYRQAFAL
jgi:glycosyltransferase involved in cell wall biosynthesis